MHNFDMHYLFILLSCCWQMYKQTSICQLPSVFLSIEYDTLQTHQIHKCYKNTSNVFIKKVCTFMMRQVFSQTLFKHKYLSVGERGKPLNEDIL